jgi:Na+/proline symporter
MGKWLRRSQVMTAAEWMQLRFGSGPDGRAARLISAVIAVLNGTFNVTYFCIGAGKFGTQMFGFEDPELGKFYSSAVIVGLGCVYTVLAGLRGVVLTDVFQGGVVFVVVVAVCITAAHKTLPETFRIGLPLTGTAAWAVRDVTREDWLRVVPQAQTFPAESEYFTYNRYVLCLSLYALRTLLDGTAGAGGYMAQRFFASSSDREVSRDVLQMFKMCLCFGLLFCAARSTPATSQHR